eukprot:9763333-Alexandrium_andersonii.AAC.1
MHWPRHRDRALQPCSTVDAGPGRGLGALRHMKLLHARDRHAESAGWGAKVDCSAGQPGVSSGCALGRV